jgi:hypothetical protein
MNLDDGMEYFKEAVAVERALEAVPLPRVSKDLERGLCASPPFSRPLLKAFDLRFCIHILELDPHELTWVTVGLFMIQTQSTTGIRITVVHEEP